MQIAYIVLALGAFRLLWSYRFSLFSHIFGKAPRSGAIALPYHHASGAEAEALLTATFRPRTPASASHSRAGSVGSLYGPSRPSSPDQDRDRRLSGLRIPALPRLSFSGLSQPATPQQYAAGQGHNPALGTRGGMLFLPLWYPTSPLPSLHSPLDAPPAYAPPSSPLLGSSSSPLPTQQGGTSAKVFRPHALHIPAPRDRYRDEESALATDDDDEDAASPQGASTSWTSYLPWWAKSGGKELDAAMGIQAEGARARTPVPAPGSDVDALSLHSVKVTRRGS